MGRGWVAFERKEMFLAPLLSNDAWHQLTDRFKNTLYQNFQVSVLCNSSPILKIFPQRGIEFKLLIFAYLFIKIRV